MFYPIRMKLTKLLLLLLLLLIVPSVYSQVSLSEEMNVDYTAPKDYTIGGITISGVRFLDQNVLIMLSGLTIGDKIKVPGDKITSAVKKLWDQGLFEDVKISISGIQENSIFLDIYLKERPRLSKFSFTGVKK
jgi:outer membrane protein insertion porin family